MNGPVDFTMNSMLKCFAMAWTMLNLESLWSAFFCILNSNSSTSDLHAIATSFLCYQSSSWAKTWLVKEQDMTKDG